MELTKELFDTIHDNCEEFNKITDYDVDVSDVLYSYLNSTPDTFYILYDWDEGKGNDPFWNNELNEHSVIAFIKDMCKQIDLYK